MLLRITIFLYLAAISFTFAHGPKKKSVKAHEHGVGILNIAQEGITLARCAADEQYSIPDWRTNRIPHQPTD